MMVAYRGSGEIVHARFRDLPEFLDPGDLLVVNNSATLPAAVPARLADGDADRAPLCDRGARDAPATSGGSSSSAAPTAPSPSSDHGARERIELPGGATRRRSSRPTPAAPASGSPRFALGEPVEDYLLRYGHPIRYAYVPGEYPLGRLPDRLRARSRQRRDAERRPPVHPAASSPPSSPAESRSPRSPSTPASPPPSATSPRPPSDTRFPQPTARLVNATREWGGRVIAVGTTVVRALETVADRDGSVTAGRGWTNEVITPERGLRAVDGLLTGWHEPEASHLSLLEAALGTESLASLLAPRPGARLPVARVRGQPAGPAVSTGGRSPGS